MDYLNQMLEQRIKEVRSMIIDLDEEEAYEEAARLESLYEQY